MPRTKGPRWPQKTLRNGRDQKISLASGRSKPVLTSTSTSARLAQTIHQAADGGTLTKPVASRRAKRARTENDNPDVKRTSKRLRVSPEYPSTTPPNGSHAGRTGHSILPTVNQAPNDVLNVLAFGSGEAGELGLGHTVTEAERPHFNSLLSPDDPSTLHIVQLDCGGMHTVALTKDNKIITWGVNDEGALGRDSIWVGKLRDIDGDPEEDGDLNPLESTPIPLPASLFPHGTKFVQVAAGDSFSLALTDTGLVYGWGTFKTPDGKKRFGYDADGNLIESREKPTLIPNLNKITQIACGANHALALDSNGLVWSWGSGEKHQLGRRRFGRGCMEYSPHPIGIRNAKYIASGEYHSFAVDTRDNVWAWGMNRFGEAGFAKSAGSDDVLLPNPMKIPDLRRKGVVYLDGGASHSAAVTSNGQCFMWGRMDVGQLGVRFSPEELKDESLVRCDARGNPRICLRPTLISGVGEVILVACGTDHTIFISKEGSAYATGFNSQYQLGLGHDDDVEVARRIKGEAIKGRIFTWAGAGGQFSMIAGPSKPSGDN